MTIRDAAKLLGMSQKTLRRWIADGRMKATMTHGPYGPQWDLADEDLDALQNGLAVVQRNLPADPHELALAIAEALGRRDLETAAAINELAEEVRQLREEVSARRRRRWPWGKG